MVLDLTIPSKPSAMKIFYQMEELLDYIELNPHKEGIIINLNILSLYYHYSGAYDSLSFVAKDLEETEVNCYDYEQIIKGWQMRFVNI